MNDSPMANTILAALADRQLVERAVVALEDLASIAAQVVSSDGFVRVADADRDRLEMILSRVIAAIEGRSE
jgi:hypothetical protein